MILCGQSPCPPPANGLGPALYTGILNPQYYGMGQWYQNITVTVPQFGGTSHVTQLGVARFYTVGVSF